MALEHRNGRVYYYQKLRRGKRVVSRYVAAGEVAIELHHLALSRRPAKAGPSDEIVETTEIVQRFEAHFKAVSVWLEVEMARRGYLRHARGEWRRMKDSGELAMGGLVKPHNSTLAIASRKSLLSQIVDEHGNPIPQIAQDLDDRVSAILREGDSSVERVLAERIALTEARVQFLEAKFSQARSHQDQLQLDKLLNSAHARLMQACRSLASVRRLPITLVQVNQQTLQSGCPAENLR
jgi:hypothetical protein